MQSFIKLNGKVFEYTGEPNRSKSDLDSKIQRTLGGSGTKDFTVIKYKYNYLFEVDSRNLSRLESIYDTHTTITLIDHYSATKTVLWSNDFSPQYTGENSAGDYLYSLKVDFEEV